MYGLKLDVRLRAQEVDVRDVSYDYGLPHCLFGFCLFGNWIDPWFLASVETDRLAFWYVT